MRAFKTPGSLCNSRSFQKAIITPLKYKHPTQSFAAFVRRSSIFRDTKTTLVIKRPLWAVTGSLIVNIRSALSGYKHNNNQLGNPRRIIQKAIKRK